MEEEPFDSKSLPELAVLRARISSLHAETLTRATPVETKSTQGKTSPLLFTLA